MASFGEHLRFGLAVHLLLLVASGGLYFAGLVGGATLRTVGLLLPLTLLGAAFPDIDSTQSLTFRFFKRYVPIILGVFGANAVLRSGMAGTVLSDLAVVRADPEFVAGLVVASTGWAIWSCTRWLIPYLQPTHRGVTHRVSTGLVLSLCVAVGAIVHLGAAQDSRGVRTAAIAAVTFFGGFLSHLVADGRFDEYLRLLRPLAVWRDDEHTETNQE
jgi:hypothetical protein